MNYYTILNDPILNMIPVSISTSSHQSNLSKTGLHTTKKLRGGIKTFLNKGKGANNTNHYSPVTSFPSFPLFRPALLHLSSLSSSLSFIILHETPDLFNLIPRSSSPSPLFSPFSTVPFSCSFSGGFPPFLDPLSFFLFPCWSVV